MRGLDHSINWIQYKKKTGRIYLQPGHHWKRRAIKYHQPVVRIFIGYWKFRNVPIKEYVLENRKHYPKSTCM